MAINPIRMESKQWTKSTCDASPPYTELCLSSRRIDARSRQEVCKRTSGGGLPDGGDCRDFDAVGVAHAAEDIAAELRRIQLAEALLSDEQ